jgi:hypothetical protein
MEVCAHEEYVFSRFHKGEGPNVRLIAQSLVKVRSGSRFLTVYLKTFIIDFVFLAAAGARYAVHHA